MREKSEVAGRSYPHIHNRERKKKSQKEKGYYGVDSGTLNTRPQSYKVAGPNTAPANVESCPEGARNIEVSR